MRLDSQEDVEKFFQIVHTTPDYYEALDLIERARAAMIRKKREFVRLKRAGDEHACAATLTRLNAEKKRINIVLHDMDWHESIRATLGQEALNAVISYRMGLYREGRGL